ncbi:P-loop containing nucleoside triphosphate hydrolase protein [Aspergillus japonicus CBS 114.51]|uniref:P-loop containing nucleoside triphosphate hydrolase protein n=1 Tax=Aspergillus japonicus CBS 114.51 TaxID=1448312 RepID=A0A8T8XES9_ASPJA|nr:P-loop containing nucleoside triphosphate hydrolase protein [Aspergillus japonicus CBS 114.51]RAH86803.1 P-loop containing nucleoside triphosphate hydrolase protein [Aspergillus japonicus CBS 114.51]
MQSWVLLSRIRRSLKRWIPSQQPQYEQVEAIDLEELRADGSRVDVARHEYGILQDWLTSLMRSVQSADYLEQAWLPGTSKDAHYYVPLAGLARQSQWLKTITSKEFLCPLLASAGLEMLASLLTLLLPLFLRRVLQEPTHIGNFVALFLASAVATLAGRAKDQICRVLSVRASSVLSLALFQKSVRFSNLAHLRSPVGKVLGSSTTDMMLVRNYVLKVHDIWSSPVQLLLIAFMIVRLLGLSGVVGYVAMSILLFSQTRANAAVGVAVEDYLRIDEVRINHLNSAFQKIRGIKSLGLESMFLKEIRSAREIQLEALWRRLRVVFCFFISINQMIPAVTAMVSLTSYWYTGHELVPEVVFPALTLFEMTFSPASKFSLSVTRQFSILPCVRRILHILQQTEHRPASHEPGEISQPSDPSTGNLIHFHDAKVSYPTADDSSTSFVLGPITMGIPAHKLTIIHGASGSGKSTVLAAIGGQAEVVEGQLLRKSATMALCTQDPWIMLGTVRDNITFLRSYEPVRYRQVVRLCCLESDIASFPGGDLAIVGESGANLSGGQKARISLARAIYSEADLLLLDDCLAAVDPRVARKLFHECILKLPQTVILVTHQAEFIRYCDHVVSLANGMVAEITLVEEERARGKVDTDLYRFYFECAGGPQFIMLLSLMLFLTVAVRIVNSFWLPWWMGNVLSVSTTTYLAGYALVVMLQAAFIASVGVILVLGTMKASRCIHEGVVTRLFRAPLDFFSGQPLGRVLNRLSVDIDGIDFRLINAGDLLLMAATSLFAAVIVLVWSSPYLLLAFGPIFYFQYRIQSLYRVSARELRRVCSILDSPVLSVITESMASMPTIQTYDARELFEERHRVALSRAIVGITVRYALETWITLRIEMLSVGLLGCAGLLGVFGVLDSLQMGLIFTLSISLSKHMHQFLWSLINVEVEMNSTERLRHYMTRIPVEDDHRVQPTSPTWMGDTPDGAHPYIVIKSPDSEPEGEIIFSNVTVQYPRSHSPSLRDFSMCIRSGEKVGIIGHSGSGKSTILAALSALAPVVHGRITIRGTPINDLPLTTLRSMVHVLPQDSVLFPGSVRQNLDPQLSHSDDTLLHALSVVGAFHAFDLRHSGPLPEERGAQADPTHHCTNSSNLLDLVIAPGGTNLSAGQAQLICLARALLANPRILVLDEATSSVDLQTENHIQLVLQEHFRDSIILCVAHRPTSVAWMDRVIVMADGMCVREEGRSGSNADVGDVSSNY